MDQHIASITHVSDSVKIPPLFLRRRQKQVQPPVRGIARQKVWLGMYSTAKKLWQTESRRPFSVHGARESIKNSGRQMGKDSALWIVNKKHVGHQEWITNSGSVSDVDQPLPLININDRDIAACCVRVTHVPVGQAIVYDLTVEQAHCFYANEVLVGNCMNALEYICTVFTSPKSSEIHRQEARRQQLQREDIGRIAWPVEGSSSSRWEGRGTRSRIVPNDGKIDW